MYNILLGGAAGDGLETMSALLEKILKNSGCHIFTIRDFMSRVRGGHNFIQIRFGVDNIATHRRELDVIVAMNEETIILHEKQLRPGGLIICDDSLEIVDERIIKLPLKATAKELGNPKVFSSVAIGAILKLFSLPIDDIEKVLKNNLKQSIQAINLLAINEGFKTVASKFKIETVSLDQHINITGTTAMALGALAANVKFYSAYPMSPSTGLLEYLSDNASKMNIAVEQAEDEIAAINMAIGASYAGVRSMSGTSGGGFCLMVEALGFAGIAEIPLVIANVQRPGPATGLPTRSEQSDLRFVISASHGEFPRLVIAIKDHRDAFYQTFRAFELADKYQIPVILLSDQHIGDSTATIPIFDIPVLTDTKDNEPITLDKDGLYQRYHFTKNGISPQLFPGKTKHLVRVDSDEHDEYGQITESAKMRIKMMDKRMNKMKLLENELIEPEFIGDDKCQTLFVGFGSTYGAIKEAVTLLNQNSGKYGALAFSDVYPLPTKLLKQYASKATQIINIEQNATGQLGLLIRETTSIECTSSILKYDGRQINVDDILDELKLSVKGGA